jgi:ribokinase
MTQPVEFTIPDRLRTRPTDILAVGSLVLEQVVKVGAWPAAGEQDNVRVERVTISAGGCAVSVACFAARLGARTGVVSAAGAGQHGRPVIDELTRAGVDTRHIRIVEGSEGSLLIILSGPHGDWATLDHGDRNVVMRADSLPAEAAFAEAKIVHIDGYSFVTIGDEAAIDEVYRRARAAGCLISVDSSVPAVTTRLAYLRALCARADIVFANEREATMIAGTATAQAAALKLQQLGPAVIVIKRGEHGSLVVHAGKVETIPAFEVQVVDTIAAGDAYVAAMLAAYCRGATTIEAATQGSAAGALACLGAGSLARYFGHADIQSLVSIGRK